MSQYPPVPSHPLRPSRPYFYLFLAASFILSSASLVIIQTKTWTDSEQGFYNGFVVSLLFLPIWLGLFVAPYEVARLLCSRYRRVRHLLWATLILPALVSISAIPEFFQEPMSPQAHFELFTKTPFPQSACEIKTYFHGGLLADHSDTFYFRCSAEDTDALIKSLKLSPASDEMNVYKFGRFSKGTDWPDASQWKGVAYYEGHMNRAETGNPEKEYAYRFYKLLTDESRTQVYLEIYNI